jgi:hypothetical protein
VATRKLAHCESELHEGAASRAGFDDFGNGAYREGLRILLEAFDLDLKLGQKGRQVAYKMIEGVLVARLFAEKGWADHAEVLSTSIRRPLIITGLPRTATTALHKLLSLDPQLQGLEFWLSQTPMMRPPAWNRNSHPAYMECVANLEQTYNRIKGLSKAHEVVACEVAECTGVLLQSFESDTWSCGLDLASYAYWFRARNAKESYRRHMDVLKLVGASEPDRLWLLKSPYHMSCMDTVLEVFPDACIIHTHRDPLEAIPSFCSLVYMHRCDLEDGETVRESIGLPQCRYWSEALSKIEAARRNSPGRFFDVDHRGFSSDPLGTVRSVYKYFHLNLSPHVEQRMRAWIAASPTTRHGKHEYSIDGWGVTSAQICDIFSGYRAQFGFC